MKRHYLFFAGLALLLAAFGVAHSEDFFARYGHAIAKEQAAASGGLVAPIEVHEASPGYFALVVQPGPGNKPVLEKISAAQKSIDLVMYTLDDIQVEKALGDAVARGVSVRVLLNGGYYSKKEQRNDGAYAELQKRGVPVRWTPTRFALTHQKTLVIDGTDALVMTFNLQSKYYATGRDFAIDDTDPVDVQAIEKVFNADWEGKSIVAPQGDDLVWSPGSEDELLYLIRSASSTLDIYNEEMADTDITAALVDAAKRGVHVRIDMTYATNWKPAFFTLRDAGVEVRTWASSSKKLYIHAKVIIVDGARAFVGSENFSDTSLNKNRELGLVLEAPQIVSGLEEIFEKDWVLARPFTLAK